MKDLKLWVELIAVFIAVPVGLWFHPTRLDGHICLWIFSVYAVLMLRHMHKLSWRNLWHGKGWTAAQKKSAVLRFVASAAAIIILTSFLVPERLFRFPIERPGTWVMVMCLYPLLSALPQELVFRSYFTTRFARLFPTPFAMVAANAVLFGLIHVMFHNFVSPSLCLVAGALFAYSYQQHRSLKWAAIEHAAYGCMVFTAGIGFYFVVGHLHP
jgi:membrane protease YdiL (CAAX protease family)